MTGCIQPGPMPGSQQRSAQQAQQARLVDVLRLLIEQVQARCEIGINELHAAGWRGKAQVLQHGGAEWARELETAHGLIVYWRPQQQCFEVYPGRWTGNSGGTWRERGADLAEQHLARLLKAGGVKDLGQLARDLLDLLQEEGEGARERLAGLVMGADQADAGEVFAGYAERLRAAATD